MTHVIVDEIKTTMKVSDEFLAVILGGFLTLMAFIVVTSVKNTTKIDALVENDKARITQMNEISMELKEINHAVNNAKPHEPTLRKLVEGLAKDVKEIKAKE